MPKKSQEFFMVEIDSDYGIKGFGLTHAEARAAAKRAFYKFYGRKNVSNFEKVYGDQADSFTKCRIGGANVDGQMEIF